MWKSRNRNDLCIQIKKKYVNTYIRLTEGARVRAEGRKEGRKEERTDGRKEGRTDGYDGDRHKRPGRREEEMKGEGRKERRKDVTK